MLLVGGIGWTAFSECVSSGALSMLDVECFHCPVLETDRAAISKPTQNAKAESWYEELLLAVLHGTVWPVLRTASGL